MKKDRANRVAATALWKMENRPFDEHLVYLAAIIRREIKRVGEAVYHDRCWRCFHCGEFFTDPKDARAHFGRVHSIVKCLKEKAKAGGK